MTLLQRMERERFEKRERLRQATREQLHEILGDVIPGRRVVVFGSLVKAGKFSEESDIDIALEAEPHGMTIYQLISVLGERMGRPIDVILLNECRFRDKILREGETWIVPA